VLTVLVMLGAAAGNHGCQVAVMIALLTAFLWTEMRFF
jgi:hypothetical protein